MNDSPLAGLVVGVTADRRKDEQGDLLSRHGAKVIHAPTIETRTLGGDEALVTATESVIADPPDIVVLSTGIGVRSWLDAAEAAGVAGPLSESVAAADIVTRGPKAYGAAVIAGWPVDWSASSATSPEILEHLSKVGVAGKRVAVLLDGNTEPVLAKAIAAMGADVLPIAAYEWNTVTDPAPVLRMVESVADERIDAVTFTSAPAASRLAVIAERAELLDPLRAALSGRVLAVCVGPVCAHAAQEIGFLNVVQPTESRLGSMVQSLVDCVVETQWVAQLGSSSLIMRASSVVVDGSVIELAPRERDVLTRLARRPGAVVGKEVLLRHIWHDRAETHAVETVVNRLRRRLDATAVRIMTVHKRGYSLVPAG